MLNIEIPTSIRRALRPRRHPGEYAAPVHFHIGADGRPFVCDVVRCDSVSLSLREIDGV